MFCGVVFNAISQGFKFRVVHFREETGDDWREVLELEGECDDCGDDYRSWREDPAVVRPRGPTGALGMSV